MQPEAIYAICGFDDIPNRHAIGAHLIAIDNDGVHRPWAIVVVRWGKKVLGYINKCPHNGVNLDWERNRFLDPYSVRLMCGKHGSTFELGTGRCVEGPCKGSALTPIALTVLDGDVCVVGVRLVEDHASRNE
ncbi:nitrite reductase/ring-hydroxylating ferredoxin subunit [Bradyrhizobium sp. i1.8.4]|uniref:Rieske (2Fe-2S) protein n=1 Tax=unclassified Bradyrhizobium TaxID=2631580 RepID=UPI003D1D13C5